VGFLAPWFLAGIAAISIPLWVHLLRKHKTVPLPFSSLMFFERRTQSSIKHRRLQYLLLLAMRLALLILLALAFASPYIKRQPLNGFGGNTLVVLAIDDSFSMRRQGALDRAGREALSAVDSLRPGQQAQVLALGSSVRVLTQPTNEKPELRAAIRAIQPTDKRSSYAELARGLRSIAETSTLPVEAHLFSDFQKTSMPSAFTELTTPAKVRMVLHPTADAPASNFAVVGVSAPQRVFREDRSKITATIAGIGTEAAMNRTVVLALNGKALESKTVQVPAGGRASVEFLSLRSPYGWNRGEVRIEEPDTLAEDNRFYFSVERSEPRRVLFIHDGRQQRSPLYFTAALESASDAAFSVETVTADQAAGRSPNGYSVVVLSDVGVLPSTLESALTEYVRSGGSVWIALGPSSSLRPRVPVFDEPVIESRYSAREGERFQAANIMDPAHPSVRKANAWEGVKFFRATSVQSGSAKVIARLTDNTPILLEKRIGQGKILVFASTFDNLSNDFPLHPSFVPFVEQTAHYLSGTQAEASTYPVGAYLELRTPAQKAMAIEVMGPRGDRALSLSEAARAQTVELEQAGFYDVRRGSGRQQLVAVNVDRAESDLEPIAEETRALWQRMGQGQAPAGPANSTEPEQSWNLWWYVLLAAFILALMESVFGSRYLAVPAGAEEPRRKEAA
jgi:hypothetical protein